MMVCNLFLEIQLAWYNLLKKDLGIFTVQVVLFSKFAKFQMVLFVFCYSVIISSCENNKEILYK